MPWHYFIFPFSAPQHASNINLVKEGKESNSTCFPKSYCYRDAIQVQEIPSSGNHTESHTASHTGLSFGIHSDKACFSSAHEVGPSQAWKEDAKYRVWRYDFWYNI